MSKILAVIFISLFVSCNFSYSIDYGQSDYLPEKIRNQGLVKVRIWLDKGGSSVGHVSLETAKAYFSLWPSECRGTVFSVAALLVKDYATDYKLEENIAPDGVFILKSNTDLIDAMLHHYRDKHGARETNKGLVLTDSVHWYSLGNRTAGGGVPIEGDRQYFNCVSFVATALHVGDDKFFENISEILGQPKTNALRDVSAQYQRDKETEQSAFTTLATSLFPDILLPRDFFRLLQHKMILDLNPILETLHFEGISSDKQNEVREDIKRRHLYTINVKKLNEGDGQDIFWRKMSGTLKQTSAASTHMLSLMNGEFVHLHSQDVVFDDHLPHSDDKKIKKNKFTCLIL